MKIKLIKTEKDKMENISIVHCNEIPFIHWCDQSGLYNIFTFENNQFLNVNDTFDLLPIYASTRIIYAKISFEKVSLQILDVQRKKLYDLSLPKNINLEKYTSVTHFSMLAIEEVSINLYYISYFDIETNSFNVEIIDIKIQEVIYSFEMGDYCHFDFICSHCSEDMSSVIVKKTKDVAVDYFHTIEYYEELILLKISHINNEVSKECYRVDNKLIDFKKKTDSTLILSIKTKELTLINDIVINLNTLAVTEIAEYPIVEFHDCKENGKYTGTVSYMDQVFYQFQLVISNKYECFIPLYYDFNLCVIQNVKGILRDLFVYNKDTEVVSVYTNVVQAQVIDNELVVLYIEGE